MGKVILCNLFQKALTYTYIAVFHAQGHGNWSICSSGQKILATIFVNIGIGQKHNKILRSQETDRPWIGRTEQYASKEDCIK